MDKKIIIGGGVAVAVVGFLIYRAAHKVAPVDQTASDAQSVGNIPSYASSGFSSLLPISGGTTSYNTTPTDPTNSGSTSSGGGFDLSAIFGALISSNSAHASAQTQADASTADSAILASIIGSNAGGTISHSGSATTIGIDKGNGVDQIIAEQYQSLLGRAPDSGGAAFWSDHFYNDSNFGVADFISSIKNSDEYKANQAALAAKPASSVTPNTTPGK